MKFEKDARKTLLKPILHKIIKTKQKKLYTYYSVQSVKDFLYYNCNKLSYRNRAILNIYKGKQIGESVWQKKTKFASQVGGLQVATGVISYMLL